MLSFARNNFSVQLLAGKAVSHHWVFVGKPVDKQAFRPVKTELMVLKSLPIRFARHLAREYFYITNAD